MSNDLIVGYGEVGQALHEIIPDAQVYDVKDGPPEMIEPWGWKRIHIAFPWNKYFLADVDFFQPDASSFTCVYSTVPIGTCEKLGVVHSPVEGTHPNLTESIRKMTRWIGSSDMYQRQAVESFWANKGVDVMTVGSADYTEFLKLRSTARYGINIAFADYEAQVADSIDMPYQLLKDFDRDYNQLYRVLTKGGSDVGRYVLDDPKGEIGGHCIVPNAKILNEQYPDQFLDDIIRMGIE